MLRRVRSNGNGGASPAFGFAAWSRWSSPTTGLQGTTADLSLGGVLVQSRRVFPPGTLVALRLELEAGKPPLLSDARVVRTVGADSMGVQFENLAATESTRLQEFLLPLILAASRCLEIS